MKSSGSQNPYRDKLSDLANACQDYMTVGDSKDNVAVDAAFIKVHNLLPGIAGIYDEYPDVMGHFIDQNIGVAPDSSRKRLLLALLSSLHPKRHTRIYDVKGAQLIGELAYAIYLYQVKNEPAKALPIFEKLASKVTPQPRLSDMQASIIRMLVEIDAIYKLRKDYVSKVFQYTELYNQHFLQSHSYDILPFRLLMNVDPKTTRIPLDDFFRSIKRMSAVGKWNYCYELLKFLSAHEFCQNDKQVIAGKFLELAEQSLSQKYEKSMDFLDAALKNGLQINQYTLNRFAETIIRTFKDTYECENVLQSLVKLSKDPLSSVVNFYCAEDKFVPNFSIQYLDKVAEYYARQQEDKLALACLQKLHQLTLKPEFVTSISKVAYLRGKSLLNDIASDRLDIGSTSVDKRLQTVVQYFDLVQREKVKGTSFYIDLYLACSYMRDEKKACDILNNNIKPKISTSLEFKELALAYDKVSLVADAITSAIRAYQLDKELLIFTLLAQPNIVQYKDLSVIINLVENFYSGLVSKAHANLAQLQLLTIKWYAERRQSKHNLYQLYKNFVNFFNKLDPQYQKISVSGRDMIEQELVKLMDKNSIELTADSVYQSECKNELSFKDKFCADRAFAGRAWAANICYQMRIKNGHTNRAPLFACITGLTTPDEKAIAQITTTLTKDKSPRNEVYIAAIENRQQLLADARGNVCKAILLQLSRMPNHESAKKIIVKSMNEEGIKADEIVQQIAIDSSPLAKAGPAVFAGITPESVKKAHNGDMTAILALRNRDEKSNPKKACVWHMIVATRMLDSNANVAARTFFSRCIEKEKDKTGFWKSPDQNLIDFATISNELLTRFFSDVKKGGLENDYNECKLFNNPQANCLLIPWALASLSLTIGSGTYKGNTDARFREILNPVLVEMVREGYSPAEAEKLNSDVALGALQAEFTRIVAPPPQQPAPTRR